MSAHKVVDKGGHSWSVGFDNPSGGFFATRFLPDSEAEARGEEADVLIGFGRGVEITELIFETGRHGLHLSDSMVDRLLCDRENETRPLTPLQQLVRSWAIDAGAFGG